MLRRVSHRRNLYTCTLFFRYPRLTWQLNRFGWEAASIVSGCICMSISPPVRTGVTITVAILVVWTLLALVSPTLTYHFAPLIAAAVTPLWSRREGRQTTAAASRFGALSFGAVSALGVGLWATDNLRGPTLWGSDGAIIEVVIFAALGALIGVRSATSKRQGLLATFVSAENPAADSASEVR